MSIDKGFDDLAARQFTCAIFISNRHFISWDKFCARCKSNGGVLFTKCTAVKLGQEWIITAVQFLFLISLTLWKEIAPVSSLDAARAVRQRREMRRLRALLRIST